MEGEEEPRLVGLGGHRTDDTAGPAPPPEGHTLRLDRRLEECLRRWELTPEDPYPSSPWSRVVAVRRRDGAAAVLKVSHVHRESEHEADALARWDGVGAVALLARDDARGALLTARCEPGTALAGLDPERALGVVIDLLPRLWVGAGAPFRTLDEEVTHWRRHLPANWEGAGRPFERRLVDAALEQMRVLAPTQGQRVLVHQDLHAGNVLRHGRRWLAIDPKPLLAERAFSLSPLVRGPELGAARADVRRRLDRLSAELGVERRRVAGWTLAHTLAWAFADGAALGGHLEVARFLADEL